MAAASPRMTRDLIDEIVINALRATNLEAERDVIVKATNERVRAVLIAKLPPEYVALTAQHPREWFCWQHETYSGSREFNPVAIMSGELTHRAAYLTIEPTIPVLGHTAATMKADVDLADLIEQAVAWRTKRDQAADELRAFLRSCSSVAKAIERMPEIEKHIPTGVRKTYNVVVAPTIALSLLTKLGFDTTAEA